MNYFSMRPEGQITLVLGFLKKAVNIKGIGDILNPEMLWKCFIKQDRILRLNYKATEF